MFNFSKVQDKVYLIQADSSYDLASMFVRYQECYECPSEKFRGKNFTLAEYQSWYVSTFNKDCFTYPVDWGGFNLPGHIILNYGEVKDRNFYDDILIGFAKKIASTDDKFYIIGSRTGNDKTITHELAHAIYYVEEDYKYKVSSIIDSLKHSIYNHFKARLLANNYCEAVIDDEINAYLVAGTSSFLEIEKLDDKDKKLVKILTKNLQTLFKEFDKRK